jgi:pSer/pThr/pTyr-binding forkhead associated (FHA) protein
MAIAVAPSREAVVSPAEQIKDWQPDRSRVISKWQVPRREEDQPREVRDSGLIELSPHGVMEIVLAPDANGGIREGSGVIRIAQMGPDDKLWVVGCQGANGLKPKAYEVSDQAETVDGAVLTFGRSGDNDIQFLKSNDVSGSHGRIILRAWPGKYTVQVEDEGSTNGTAVCQMPKPEERGPMVRGIMSGDEAGRLQYQLINARPENWTTHEVPWQENMMQGLPVLPGRVYEIRAGSGKIRVGVVEGKGVVMTRVGEGQQGLKAVSMDLIADNSHHVIYTYGRSRSCSIKLDEPDVSRHHGSIGFTMGTEGPLMWVKDGTKDSPSSNGTSVSWAEMK